MTKHPPLKLPLPKDTPVRILVQAVTQRVPTDLGLSDNVWGDKMTSMLHRISQYHWASPYVPSENRHYTHGDDFGHNDRLCFFLVDHYGAAAVGEKVPNLFYEWTGEGFKPTPKLGKWKPVNDKLRQIRFLPARYSSRDKVHKMRSVREQVRRRLRKAQRIPDFELRYLRKHPEDMRWLAEKIQLRFWRKLVPQVRGAKMRKVKGPIPCGPVGWVVGTE